MEPMDLYVNSGGKLNADTPEKKSGQMKKAAVALARALPMAVAFFLFSLIQCFSKPSPFAVCCMLALLGAGIRPHGALLGLGLGLGFRLLWGLPMELGQIAACLLCFVILKLGWNKPWQLTCASGGLNLARALPECLAAGDTQTVILCLASVAMGLAVMPALHRAALILKEKRTRLSQDDTLCLALPILLLITGAGRLAVFQVNLGYGCAALITLGVSWMCGSAPGACLGLACGLTLLIGGQSALPMINLAFGALVAGLFQGRKRPYAAMLFLVATLIATYLVAYSLQPPLTIAEFFAALIICLIPGKWMGRLRHFARQLRWTEPRENAYTHLKMRQWARSIDKMADALPHPRIEPVNSREETEAIRDALCAECGQLPLCWHTNMVDTQSALEELAGSSDDTEASLEIINRCFTFCPRIARLPDILTRLDREKQKRLQRALCAEYERDMLQTHLTALSQAAQRIMLEGGAEDERESAWTAQAQETLERLHFPGQIAFVKRPDGRMTVCLTCDPLALRSASLDEVVREIGRALLCPLAVSEQRADRILLEEEPPLSVQAGIASACAAGTERKRRAAPPPDNGDAVLTEALSGGLMLLALSDGMGHGAGARDESWKTLELLSLCLGAGYTRAQAMTAVNGAMLSATGGEKFATVDLCLIDLWSGQAFMNKLGACASFIIQGQKIHTVEGAALPLGIIEHVVPMEHRFSLSEGDMLVMMSDGVSEVFEEETIIGMIRAHRDDTPQQLADCMLDEAKCAQDGKPIDDMTVLCARVSGKDRRRRL